MTTNLTTSRIKDTFPQLLHVSDGPAAAEKVIHSGTGVPTALRIGTQSISVGTVRVEGNAITNTAGSAVALPNVTITGGTIAGIMDLAIADGGTGASTASGARTNLGLGTLATQNANAINITGGTVSNVTFTGSFVGITLIESDTFRTVNGANGLDITSTTIAAEGTSANLDITLTPKGTGEVNISKVDIDGGTIDGTTIGAATPAAATFTDLTAAGTISFSGATVSDGGTVTTVAISGGTIDGTTIGAATPSSMVATTVEATTSIGYPTGTGGTVTQGTNKSTGVTLNKISGQITMNAATLNRNSGVSFTLTNSFIAATDVVVVNIASGATPNIYTITVDAVAAGSCVFHLHNHSTGTDLSEAVVLNFVVIKGAHS
jgi:hypothetical protein